VSGKCTSVVRRGTDTGISRTVHYGEVRTVFLKLSATADHYMGRRRMRGPQSYRNILLSLKEHPVALFSANGRKIIVKVAINQFFLSTIIK
jgi:hypothetical protein